MEYPSTIQSIVMAWREGDSCEPWKPRRYNSAYFLVRKTPRIPVQYSDQLRTLHSSSIWNIYITMLDFSTKSGQIMSYLTYEECSKRHLN